MSKHWQGHFRLGGIAFSVSHFSLTSCTDSNSPRYLHSSNNSACSTPKAGYCSRCFRVFDHRLLVPCNWDSESFPMPRTVRTEMRSSFRNSICESISWCLPHRRQPRSDEWSSAAFRFDDHSFIYPRARFQWLPGWHWFQWHNFRPQWYVLADEFAG